MLATLLPLLRLYDKDENIQNLADRLEKVKQLYEQVKITIEPGEPESVIVDGVLTFRQNDKQTIEASPEAIEAIMQEITDIRTEQIASK